MGRARSGEERGVGKRGEDGRVRQGVRDGKKLAPGGRTAGARGVAALSPARGVPSGRSAHWLLAAPTGTQGPAGRELGEAAVRWEGPPQPSQPEPAGWCSEEPPPPLQPRPGQAADWGCGSPCPPLATALAPAFSLEGEQPPGGVSALSAPPPAGGRALG